MAGVLQGATQVAQQATPLLQFIQGDFHGMQEGQKLAQKQAQEAAQKQGLQAFIDQRGKELGITPEIGATLKQLPLDAAISTLGQYQTQKNTNTSNEFRAKSEGRAQAGLSLQAEANARAADKLAQEKADRAAAKAAADSLAPAGALLQGNDKLRFDALLKAGKISEAQALLKPEKPKPGTIQGLLAAGINIADPEQVRGYYGSTLTKDKAAKASDLFLAQYTKQPGFFEGLFGTTPSLTAAGAKLLQTGATPAPGPVAPGSAPIDPLQRLQELRQKAGR